MLWIVFRHIRVPVEGAGFDAMHLRLGEVDAPDKTSAERLARQRWAGNLLAVSRLSFELTQREYSARKMAPYWTDVLPPGARDVAHPFVPESVEVVPMPDPEPAPAVVSLAEARAAAARKAAATKAARVRARHDRLAALARRRLALGEDTPQ
jgi:hypothetical protein